MRNEKTRVTQNLCNLSYLIRQRQDHQKTVQLKVFTTSQIYMDPIQKRALSKFVQLKVLLYSIEVRYTIRLTKRIKGNKMIKNMLNKINDGLYNLCF